MSDPFRRNRYLFHVGLNGYGRANSNEDEDEEREDQVVYSHSNSGLGDMWGQLRRANNDGNNSGGSSVVTGVTTVASAVAETSANANGVGYSGGGSRHTARLQELPLPRAATTTVTTNATTATAAVVAPGIGPRNSPTPLTPPSAATAIAGAGIAPLSSLYFADTTTVQQRQISIDSDVFTMGNAVLVPPALRPSATRRTMLDVLVDVKRRKEEEASVRATATAEQQRRRLHGMRDATLTELFDRRQQVQQRRRDNDDDDGGGGGGGRGGDGVASHPTGSSSNNGSAVGETSRGLRHLLPGHLLKKQRERDVEVALEKRRLAVAEQAMALDISDFSGSDRSSSSSGSENAEDDRDNDNGRRVGAVSTTTAKARSGGKKGTVMTLLFAGEDNDEEEEDEHEAHRGGRTIAPVTPAAPPQRSVMDLFAATERQVQLRAKASAAKPLPSQQQRGRAEGSKRLKTVLASDLVDGLLDEEESARNSKLSNAYDSNGKSNRNSRRGTTVINTDPFLEDTAVFTIKRGIEIEGDDDDDDYGSNINGNGEGNLSRGAVTGRKLDDLLDDSPADGTMHGTDQRQHSADRLRQQQQQRWLLLHQRLVDNINNDMVAGDPGAIHAATAARLGIVGKPSNVCLTSIASAAGGATATATAFRNRRDGYTGRNNSFYPPSQQQQPPQQWGTARLSSTSAAATSGDAVELTVFPRLITSAKQQQQLQQLVTMMSGGGGGGGSEGHHSGSVRQLCDNPTAVRVVEYLRGSFDGWLIDGPAILRELNSREEAETEAEAAAAHASPDINHNNGADGSTTTTRSNLASIFHSALSQGGGGGEKKAWADQLRLSSQQRQQFPAAVPYNSVASPPPPAVSLPLLEGSGTHVKLRVSFADSAFGITRVVGDVEWMSAEARRRCDMLDDKQQHNNDNVTTLKYTDALLSGLLFSRRPNLQALERRRWSLVLPEHLFQTLPFSIGRCVYVGSPFYAFPDTRTILSSYCVTTEALVTRSVNVLNSLLQQQQQAVADAAAAAAAASSSSQRRRARDDGRRDGNREGHHADNDDDGDEERVTASASSLHGGLERHGTANIHSALSLNQQHASENREAFNTICNNDNDDVTTPVPRRRHDNDGNGNYDDDEDGTATGKDHHHHHDHGRGWSYDREASCGVSISRTPFRGNQYDPLAYPGITTVGVGANNGTGRSNMDFSEERGFHHSNREGETSDVALARFSNATLTDQTRQRPEGVGGGLGYPTSDNNSGSADGGSTASQQLINARRDPNHYHRRGSNSNIRSRSHSRAKQQQQQREEFKREAREAADRVDPTGAGFPRGPGAGWELSLDVIRVLVASGNNSINNASPSVGRPSHSLASGGGGGHGHGIVHGSATATVSEGTLTTTASSIPSNLGRPAAHSCPESGHGNVNDSCGGGGGGFPTTYNGHCHHQPHINDNSNDTSGGDGGDSPGLWPQIESASSSGSSLPSQLQ